MLRQKDQDEQLLKRQQIYDSLNPKYIKIFQEIYEKNIQEIQSEPQSDLTRIPRIVHQIWLGSKVPEKYRSWMESWMNMQGWEYWLWTDEEVMQFQMSNQDLFDRSENFGEKADILRLEILYKYGGLYIDTDFECVRPELFDELHRFFDFYIGFEALEHGSVGKFNMFKICNAIIGAAPGHPIIGDLITNMRANFLAYRHHTGPLGTTGPNYVTRIICEYVENKVDTLRNMFFPTTVFYPFSAIEIVRHNIDPSYNLPIFPETLGIHYWNLSWVKHDEKLAVYNPPSK